MLHEMWKWGPPPEARPQREALWQSLQLSHVDPSTRERIRLERVICMWNVASSLKLDLKQTGVHSSPPKSHHVTNEIYKQKATVVKSLGCKERSLNSAQPGASILPQTATSTPAAEGKWERGENKGHI